MDGGKFSAAVKAEALDRLTKAEARRRDLLKCGTPAEDAGCGVTVRYIAQVGRGGALAQVFALMLAGFELASAATPVVSLNLVQAEDDPNALGNFRLHMSMLDFLHARYPTVPITLHAGELTEGLVTPDALRFHIRESVLNGHAARIGHGVDIFNEDDPFALLRDMAAKKVLVEIALSSNDQILGVKGKRHPLRMYLQHGVPVTLVTDDMGVARSSHTQEYLKAVEEQDLDYPTLKRMVRNSIEYAFADSATKARLKSDLESALTAFERLQSARAPKS
jgi:adenosine deaminase